MNIYIFNNPSDKCLQLYIRQTQVQAITDYLKKLAEEQGIEYLLTGFIEKNDHTIATFTAEKHVLVIKIYTVKEIKHGDYYELCLNV